MFLRLAVNQSRKILNVKTLYLLTGSGNMPLFNIGKSLTYLV